MMRSTCLLAAYFAMIIVGHGMVAAEPTVVTLTQTGCQFLEPAGKSQDYHIDLKEGSYVYSCPLNPTPDYPIVVKP